MAATPSESIVCGSLMCRDSCAESRVHWLVATGGVPACPSHSVIIKYIITTYVCRCLLLPAGAGDLSEQEGDGRKPRLRDMSVDPTAKQEDAEAEPDRWGDMGCVCIGCSATGQLGEVMLAPTCRRGPACFDRGCRHNKARQGASYA